VTTIVMFLAGFMAVPVTFAAVILSSWAIGIGLLSCLLPGLFAGRDRREIHYRPLVQASTNDKNVIPAWKYYPIVSKTSQTEEIWF